MQLVMQTHAELSTESRYFSEDEGFLMSNVAESKLEQEGMLAEGL